MKRGIQRQPFREGAGEELFHAYVPRSLPPDPQPDLSATNVDLLSRERDARTGSGSRGRR